MAGGAGAGLASSLLRRVVDDLDQATIGLVLIDDDPVEAVHSTRKRIKRIRAAARLLRPADPRRIRREDAVLRASAVLLGPIRDRHVAQHLATQRGRWPGDLMPPPMAPSARIAVAQATANLVGSRARVADWDVGGLQTSTVLAGTDKAYRQAWTRWKAAADHLDRDDLHQCRKALKRSVYQLEAISSAFAADPRLVDMAQLGELLGDHHDLGLIPDHDREEEAELELEVLEVGGRVFSVSPKHHRAWVRTVLRA